MRVLFFGTAPFAVPSLECLAQAHQVVCCVTQPDRPQGRGLQPEPSPVKQAAQRLGLPLLQPERLAAEAFAPYQADIGIVAAYGKLIAPSLLALPAHGMLGVHPSLLPKYRGAAPVPWTLINGDQETGVSIFRLSERMDEGELLVQHRTAVQEGETAEALLARLAHAGAEALLEGLAALTAGRARFVPQAHEAATLAPKLTKAQGEIDWSRPARELEGLIRGVIPWPGASTLWRGQPVKIWQARAEAGEAAGAAGTVLRVAGEGVLVAAGQGALLLQALQPPGKRRMTAAEFAAGYRVTVGDRFGV